MVMTSLLSGCSFDPKTVQIITSACDNAWEAIDKSGISSDDAMFIRELLAKRITATATGGERNPERLIDDALAYLGTIGSSPV